MTCLVTRRTEREAAYLMHAEPVAAQRQAVAVALDARQRIAGVIVQNVLVTAE